MGTSNSTPTFSSIPSDPSICNTTSSNNSSTSSPILKRRRTLLPDPIAETTYGAVEGKRMRLPDGRLVNLFLGIPYAQPPVGELRFKKPEPPVPWTLPLPTKSYRHRAIQRDFFWDTVELRVGKSEDCLHLNVMAPEWSAKPEFPKGFAVMVYIHGGGYVMDSAVKYHYAKLSKNLVSRSVIVVTIQYRLGFLGYFSTGDANCPGNFGLWDQVTALKWVRENISAFGGDPLNITVFGQSAGAASADILSLLPESRDLFQQLILMGGSAETMWAASPKEKLVEYCRDKALKLGFKRKGESWTEEENRRLMEFLRRLPAEKFEKTMIGDRIVIEEMRIPLTPVIDGDLLPKSLSELRKESPVRRVIAGVCKYEGLLFLALGRQRANAKFLKYCESRGLECCELANNMMDTPEHQISPAEFKELYGLDGGKQMLRNKRWVQRTVVEIMSDLVNNLPLQNYCRNMAENGSTVYRYCFEHYNPQTSLPLNLLLPFTDATHCTELAYVFDVNMYVTPWRRTRKDRKVLEKTTRMWTNFAKYGDPNGKESGSLVSRNPSLDLSEIAPKTSIAVSMEASFELENIDPIGKPLKSRDPSVDTLSDLSPKHSSDRSVTISSNSSTSFNPAKIRAAKTNPGEIFDFAWEPVDVKNPGKHLLIGGDKIWMKMQLDNKRIEKLAPGFQYLLH